MMASKNEVRRDALKARRSLTEGQVGALSALIQRALMTLPEFVEAGTVASYVAKSEEVQTREILLSTMSSGKRLLVPRSDPSTGHLHFCRISSLEQLVLGNFGILEPPPELEEIPLHEAQLVVVPVVAWDNRGQRVGYGRGFFDRELRVRGRAVCAGLAFESQRRDRLPVTRSDVPLDIIVTERRVIRFGRAANA